MQGFGVGIAAEQPLIFDQGFLDLDVLRQHGAIGHAEAFGRFALGDQEITDAMFGHDPCGFLGERTSQMFTADAQSFSHAPIIWPVRRKIKRLSFRTANRFPRASARWSAGPARWPPRR